MHIGVQIAGHESSVSAGESEGSMNSSDVLINCGDPQGERQLLRLGGLPDAVDRDTQVSILSYCSNSVTNPASQPVRMLPGQFVSVIYFHLALCLAWTVLYKEFLYERMLHRVLVEC